MLKRLLFGTLTPLALGIFAVRPVSAQLVVGSCVPGTSYPTISKAVAAARSSATIQICPGKYPEQIVITKSLTLSGVTSSQLGYTSSLNAVVTSPAAGVQQNTTALADAAPVAAQILVMNTSNVTLSNFAVDGSNNGITGCGPDLQGIYFQNASGKISGMVVRNQALTPNLNGCQSGEGIYVESKSYGTGNVSISNTSVHGYQKNGITSEGAGANVTIQNSVIDGQGPTSGAAENGIQISDGAAGSISDSTVSDNVYTGPTYGASAILVYASQNVSISNNIIGNSQLPIVMVSDSTDPSAYNPQGKADGTLITGNIISNSNFADGIDACSNHNTITNNSITNTLVSGIHLDNGCGTASSPTGQSNIVVSNTINESCAGLLVPGTGSKSGLNTISGNTINNVQAATLIGNSCPVTPAATAAVTTLFAPVAAPATGLAVSRR